ncbi:iron-sulfur cluster carrier protein ApbC [Ferrimonas aestuarii]|uniref:iron-sulfur cluster carrier protein ApbC n=1 Tax=Ferrimonas aestuarii TaxID=2569539 RepID=UPI002277312F|nr:iron-sulfur cluster carrier protein ApbC [Ferrimonas aestuarii]
MTENSENPLDNRLSPQLSQSVLSALAKVHDPLLNQSILDAGIVRRMQMDGECLALNLVYPYPCRSQYPEKVQEITQAVAGIDGIEEVECSVDLAVPVIETAVGDAIAGVKNVVAVSSGKGGVGKSTTAVNLALALAYEGARVGILDADIYGPSIPLMLGVSDFQPVSVDGKTMEPAVAHGIAANSIGFMVGEEQATVWRGPMAAGALIQMMNETNWPDLDYLVIDMPPGTGDIQLTLSQKVPVVGAVVVTTPQEVATLDARKGISMFNKVNIPVLGIVENMSYHLCSQCGSKEHPFGQGGGQATAERYGVELLGELPLNVAVREAVDQGKPSVAANPEDDISKQYIAIARETAAAMVRLSKPLELEIEISDD